MTSIKGYVEGLHDGIANTVIMKTKYYEAIETGIDTLETLVSSLSDFSKTEQGFNSDFGCYAPPELTVLSFAGSYAIKAMCRL